MGNQQQTSQSNSKRQRLAWLPVLVAAAATAGFVAASAIVLRVGFPLDDAWIHQTFARNLAQRGQWAFIPGQPSAGSTAPLWSFLLSFGYLFTDQAPYVWTFAIGAASLAGVALLGNRLADGLYPEWKPRLPVVALFLALEWHLVWAAASGMETALMAAGILAVFVLLLPGGRYAFWAGAVTGLTAWVRPDGITLLGPIFFCLVLAGGSWRDRARSAVMAAIGFLLLFAPYLFFNQFLAGSWWPNTFYAKQAEYAVLREIPFVSRWISIAALPLIGAGVLLVPGFVYQVFDSVRSRSWLSLAAALWWGGYTTIYALLLPVTYQHGRYLIPAMPVFFVLGLVGTGRLIRETLMQPRHWVLRTAWMTAIAAVALAFYGVGANAYANDVAVIETEMVAAAHWLAANTRPADRIAVHDIGAVGYFTQPDLLVDLAGLASPEVIPFIRDENRIAAYLDEQQVDYLVIFPNWYPDLAAMAEPVFSTGGTYSPRFDQENLEVFRWPSAQAGSQ